MPATFVTPARTRSAPVQLLIAEQTSLAAFGFARLRHSTNGVLKWSTSQRGHKNRRRSSLHESVEHGFDA